MSEIQNQNIENQPVGGVHHEIAELEEKLTKARQRAAESGLSEGHKEESMKETVKEHVEEKRREILEDLEASKIKDVEAQENAMKLKEQAEERQFEELTKIALSNGPTHAMHIAEKLKNPHLVDMLHDYLTSDEPYRQLVEARKLKSEL